MYNLILQFIIISKSSTESKTSSQTLALGPEGPFKMLLLQSTKEPVTVRTAKKLPNIERILALNTFVFPCVVRHSSGYCKEKIPTYDDYSIV